MKILITSLAAICLLLNAQPINEQKEPIKIGLALSGGGALGLAHIGVLKVLEEQGIVISYVSGNSMGSLVGGLYAAGYSPTQIESIVKNVNWSTLFSSDIPFGARYLPERQANQRYIFQLRHKNFIPTFPGGLIPLQNVEFLLMRLLSDIEYNTSYDFDSLPIPYRAIAVDLGSGKKVTFKDQRLANAIRSSIAIPGVFAPEQVNGKEYVDGGVIQNLPIDPLLEFRPDFIIASLVMKHNIETGPSLIDVISRSIDLVGVEDLHRQKELADILIEPNVDPFSHSEFSRAPELIQAGEQAAWAMIPLIKSKINNKEIVADRNEVRKKPKSIIRSIRFQGLRTTREDFIRSKIKLHKGSNLKFDQLISDLRSVYNTDFFEHVDYRLEFAHGDSVDLIYELRERPFGFYSFGILYDNYDNVNFGFAVGQGNLAGSGANVRLALNLGNPNEIRLGLTGTRLYRASFGYRVDGFWNSVNYDFYINRQYLTQYNIENRGLIAEAGYIIGNDAFFNFGIKGYQSVLEKPAIAFFDTLALKPWIIGPKIKLEFNNFDNLDFPTRGITYQLRGIYSMPKLKSSEHFLKISYYSEQVISLSSWFFLHPKLEIGLSWGRLSFAEYFRSGAHNFQGFSKDEFTSDQKAIIGVSSDFRLFQLFNRNDYPFFLQVFTQLATFRDYNQLLNHFNFSRDFHWSASAGIRTNTPFGPFQVSVGIADFNKAENIADRKIEVLVSMGREFRYKEDY